MTAEQDTFLRRINDWQERLFRARDETSRQLKEANREIELARLGDGRAGDYVAAARRRLVIACKELDAIRLSIDTALAERAATSAS